VFGETIPGRSGRSGSQIAADFDALAAVDFDYWNVSALAASRGDQAGDDVPQPIAEFGSTCCKSRRTHLTVGEVCRIGWSDWSVSNAHTN